MTSPTPIAFGDPRLSFLFWLKVRKQRNGCWQWTGAVMSKGYASCWDSRTRKTELGHRLVYRRLVGDVPDGMTVDHTCHNDAYFCPGGTDCPHRLCVNPAHLEVVTYEVNNRRAWRPWICDVRNAECPQGHRLPETGKRRGTRVCRRCLAGARRSRKSPRPVPAGSGVATAPPGGGVASGAVSPRAVSDAT